MQSRHLPALIVSVWLANPAQGAGFALIEQNASGLGNAYAGQAAVAEDASTIFFNPAGLTYVEGRQVVAAGHLIMPSAEFSDAGSTLAIRGDGGDAGVTAFVPNFYYAMDVTPDLKFGLGVNAPFGLTTEYDDTWAGQVQAIKSDLKTVNVNPALGWRVNDRLSLGFGLNWQYIEAELTQGTGAAVNPPEARMEGDDASWGWNIGVLWDIDGFNRLGIAYRAAIDHSLEGKLKTPLGATPVYADVEMPASASLSYWRRLSPAWELLADLTWTEWSSFEKLDVVRKADDAVLSHIPEMWENAWRYSLGLTYRPSRAWTWRSG
ncbi:MAG: outer membrane protein transport protein, partial [Thiobacillaceae bacterium]|nr:outer membrane protein transport protein [Thiobacillaceae bacterium]